MIIFLSNYKFEASCVVVNVSANILLISGANKDYSRR